MSEEEFRQMKQAIETSRQTYDKRDTEMKLLDRASNIYHPRHTLGDLYRRHMQREMIRALNRLDIELAGKQALDFGCGIGWWLRFLVELDLPPREAVGLDISQERIRIAESRNASVNWRHHIVPTLPFDDAWFDIVMQCTVFSSIPERAAHTDFARELLRVLKPGGWLIWLDLIRGNDSLIGYDRDSVAALFPSCNIALCRPVNPRYFRRLHSRAPVLAEMLSLITKADRESLLIFLRKQADAD